MTESSKYIYTFNYDYHHEELCKLESRQLFGHEQSNKLLFSDVEVDPSISPFIKYRLDIISSSADYDAFLEGIKQEKIELHGFTVEYLLLSGQSTTKPERRTRQKDVGYCIEGAPNFQNPKVIYAVCCYKGIWHFGVLTKENTAWHYHRQKPHSFSNSIGTIIAKSLVSIATKGDKTKKLLDGCCGVGTVILEACISGFRIEGCEINSKAYEPALKNLAHYGYEAKLYHSDIKDLDSRYDAAIVDLPYNLYSLISDGTTSHIISSAAALADRLVIVSIEDISSALATSGLKVTDTCTVVKRGKSKFTRTIWVCER